MSLMSGTRRPTRETVVHARLTGFSAQCDSAHILGEHSSVLRDAGSLFFFAATQAPRAPGSHSVIRQGYGHHEEEWHNKSRGLSSNLRPPDLPTPRQWVGTLCAATRSAQKILARRLSLQDRDATRVPRVRISLFSVPYTPPVLTAFFTRFEERMCTGLSPESEHMYLCHSEAAGRRTGDSHRQTACPRNSSPRPLPLRLFAPRTKNPPTKSA